MSFRSQLMMVAIRGTNKYRLLIPLIFYYKPGKEYFVVPEGTITNFASIPKFLRWLVDDNEKHIREASVLHDYLYSDNCCIKDMIRKKADFILKIAMKSLGAPLWKINLVFIFVRVFGWLFYKGFKK